MTEIDVSATRTNRNEKLDIGTMENARRVALGLLVCFLVASSADGNSLQDGVAAALDRQEAWLSTSNQGPAWNRFLMTDELRDELSRPNPRRRVLATILGRYESGTTGLDRPEFVATRSALANLADTSMVPMAIRWAERVRAAATTAKSISDETLEKRRRALQAATDKLGALLNTADAGTRDGWHDFLKWSDLTEQLNNGSPDLEKLQGVARQFFNGHPGLEYPEFALVREELRAYVIAAQWAESGKSSENLAAQMESLADTLEKYNAEPTTKRAAELATLLDWLDQLGCLPKLIEEIRAFHNQPNIKLRVSEQLLSRRFSQPVSEPITINEIILGTHIRGNGLTTGTISTDIVPCETSARIDIVFRGTTTTRTVGRQKPVTIHSTGTTILEARKPLYVYPRSVSTGKAKATATTNTKIRSIVPDRKLGRRIIEKIAWKRAGTQGPATERIASARAARRLETQIEEQTGELLTRAQQMLREQLQGPLNRRGLIPEDIRTKSRHDCLLVMATQADASQLSATTQPAEFCPEDGVVAHVHESAFNNTAEKAIAGLTLTDERIAELTEELTGSIPDELQISDERDPWSISFDWQQPVTVAFDNESVTIAIRGRKFTSGERTLRKVMEMSATYTMKTTPNGVRLNRVGDIEVSFPTNREGARLRPLDRVFKTLMEKKFAGVFKPEIQGEGFQLPGRFQEVGTIRLKDLKSDGGWLSLGWK